ncbi:MAG: glycine zipper 2TM domain-containing protein [Pseudomonadota bacterium]
MKKVSAALLSGLLFSGMVSTALAETPLTPKAQYAADSKKAMTRYTDDKKLCNDESSSDARLQCRRDAKGEYDKAIATAKTQLNAAAPVASSTKNGKAVCADCGKVAAVHVSEKAGEGGPVGMIAGGVAGAVLGHQVGGGIGKDLATIAGAAGGAYAGKKIEERVRTRKVWTVSVNYANGNKGNFEFEQDPGFNVGDAVKNSGNSIVRN